LAEEEISPLEFLEIVDSKIEQVRTKSLDLSFNEILDMYRDNEFEISPDYQRLFRWPEEKESRFIESLILEMPIPPIYVIEKEESVYELIDGLQRISTYLHFRGELKDVEGKVGQLELSGCDIVTELNGYTYDKLPKTLQIRLKRSFIRVEVIRKGSDPRLRYYMFKRLNTGGEQLSDQEIRNCTIRLLDDTFNDFIIDLSTNEDFKSTICHLNDEKVEKKEDQEYVLKYFAYKLDRENYKKDISPFLTTFMEKVADENHKQKIQLDYEKERQDFEKTFKILNLTLGENAFDKMRQGRYVSGITSTHYDSFTMGLQPFLSRINIEDGELLKDLGQLMKNIKQDTGFLNNASGGGKNTKNYLQQRIAVVETKVGEFLNGRS
jgi:uncharacterized protein with ParB-like and HNH nuclease domain